MSKTLRILLPIIVLALSVVLLICSVAVAYISFFGIDNYHGDIRKVYVSGIVDIYQNTDGCKVVFVPKTTDVVFEKDLEAAKTVIETRLVNNNITDYEVYADTDKKQIAVHFPLMSGGKNIDPYSLVSKISEEGNLTFCVGQDNSNVILEGSEDIKAAYADVDPDDETKPIVSLELTNVGTAKFAQATQAYLGQTISIWMDDVMLSSPTVNSVITNGQAVIDGVASADEAADLANKINAGALPFRLEVYEMDELITVTPPLSAYLPVGLVFLVSVITTVVCIIVSLISIFVLIKNISKYKNSIKE